MMGAAEKMEFLCDEADAKFDTLDMRYPIEGGIIKNLDYMK